MPFERKRKLSNKPAPVSVLQQSSLNGPNSVLPKIGEPIAPTELWSAFAAENNCYCLRKKLVKRDRHAGRAGKLFIERDRRTQRLHKSAKRFNRYLAAPEHSANKKLSRDRATGKGRIQLRWHRGRPYDVWGMPAKMVELLRRETTAGAVEEVAR